LVPTPSIYAGATALVHGGHNIGPKVIEKALQGHPAIALVGAIGSQDAHAGELPVAYVILRRASYSGPTRTQGG
jgi:acyl-coenzyme A synthetase/AMP-(fatty) acid ligase